ncbi:MAG: hypothetical protein IPG90_17430 [Bacteroidetes bacterium]|nr:hypothetical protein [Bacteroidota bacterium]
MDKNSIIGLSIIGLLIVGYSIFTQPSKEELAAARHKQDSIAALQVQEKAMDTIQQTAVVPVNASDSSLSIPNDSILQTMKNNSSVISMKQRMARSNY